MDRKHAAIIADRVTGTITLLEPEEHGWLRIQVEDAPGSIYELIPGAEVLYDIVELDNGDNGQSMFEEKLTLLLEPGDEPGMVMVCNHTHRGDGEPPAEANGLVKVVTANEWEEAVDHATKIHRRDVAEQRARELATAVQSLEYLGPDAALSSLELITKTTASLNRFVLGLPPAKETDDAA